MEENFLQAVKWLEIDETGIEAENDPSRSANRWGVSPHMLAVWTGDSSFDDEFSRERAHQLFLDNVWAPLGCDALPAGIDYWVFDCGYRFEPRLAKQWLYMAVKLNPHVPNEQILFELLKQRTGRDIILEMDVFVRRRMKSSPEWGECKHWWTNRTNRARDRAIKLSRGEKVK